MIDTNRLVNILIDFCEWDSSVDGWVIKDNDLDLYLKILEDGVEIDER